MTLQIAPTGMGASSFKISDGSRALAEIVIGVWHEDGGLTLGGVSYRMQREQPEPRALVLEGERGVLMRAEQAKKLFSREFLIRYEGRELTLRPRGMFSRAFALLEGGREIGSLSADNIFTRKATADLPGELPILLRMFIVWLMLMSEAGSTER